MAYSWEMEELREFFPLIVCNGILGMISPSPWNEPDHSAWRLVNDGSFLTKST